MDPVRDFIDAFNAHDLDSAVAYLAPDFILESPPGTVRLPSRDAARDAWRTQFDQSPQLRIEVLTRLQIGQWVIQEQRFTGLNVPGRSPEQHMGEIFRVVDGKIVLALVLPA